MRIDETPSTTLKAWLNDKGYSTSAQPGWDDTCDSAAREYLRSVGMGVAGPHAAVPGMPLEVRSAAWVRAAIRQRYLIETRPQDVGAAARDTAIARDALVVDFSEMGD